ncbi:Structural maintenance of chromosomes protein 5 [Dipsacomyces acuminosporus]|nr:Structural maintenance of chromosomes protein 5 [Dipsacomyces acuminosporus]
MHISLRNFVTYDRIEISPGPNMNMIIGPNGTGKSTIVCAIALGLGEKPALLGRAKDISEYVKHGHQKGSVEITLAGARPNTSIKIKREISRENNKNTWELNGRSATAAEVHKATRSLNIQVNNLCQFLPQDRVVEFSKMSSQELLKETQRAVGQEKLCVMQTELVALRSSEKQKMNDLQRLKQDSETLKKQNEQLERDVQRWQERLAAESQMRVLTALVPVIKYTEAKAEHDKTKEERRKAYAHYTQVKNDTGPAEEEIAALESKIARNENTRRLCQENRNELEKTSRQHTNQLDRLEATQRDLNNELDEIKKRAQRRRETIQKMREEIQRLEAAHPEASPEGETEDMRRIALDIREQKLQMNDEITRLQDEQRTLMDEGRKINGEVEKRDQRLRDLDNVATRRRETLRKFNEDTFRALEWLENNRSRFSQHVFSPICLEASVQDSRYANLVESIVSMSTLRTFVAQCEEDYYTFTREVNDRMKLRVDVVCFRKDLDEFRVPQPRETLAKLGFDGYALDFIEAPRAVLAAICNRDNVHEVPIALGRVNNEQIESQMLFKEYISEGTKYSITRGRYGSRSATVMTSRTKPQARLLSSGETDEVRSMRTRYREEIDKFRDELVQNEQKMKKLSVQDRKVRDAHRNVEAQEGELRQARKRANEEVRKWETQKIHIDTKRAQLASMLADERRDAREGGSRAEQEKRKVIEDLKENTCRRADTVGEIAVCMGQMAGVVHDLALATMAGFKDTQHLSELKTEAARHRDAILEAQREFERANERYNDAKHTAKICLDETRKITESMTDEERQAVREAQEQRRNATLEELEIELATCRQRLNLASNSGLSARVMEQYEERKQRLAHMLADLQRLEHELESARRKKLRLRDKWERPLEELIERIGVSFRQMFDQIGCMGEVSLYRAGDGVVYSNATLAGHPLPAASQRAGRKRSVDIKSQSHLAAGAEDDDSNDGEDGNGLAIPNGMPRDDEDYDNWDYDNWGVEIRVSFRDNEPLQSLNNHRQSGGERAVTTILYLQSLQSLVTAPFRVVDEINQGMDQRNERLVHRLIVNTACREGSAQYFLITPKLLTDLSYHPLMKVLCIFNGEWQPESFNFSKYITNARRGVVRA